jgi:hypothetical protein
LEVARAGLSPRLGPFAPVDAYENNKKKKKKKKKSTKRGGKRNRGKFFLRKVPSAPAWSEALALLLSSFGGFMGKLHTK